MGLDGLAEPSGIAVDARGVIYIVDDGNDRILQATPSASGADTLQFQVSNANGTAPGVDLPDGLRTPAVPLQIGYNMPLPIPDLRIDDWGVTCTLSFRRTPHTCRIPWNAIFAFTDGEATLQELNAQGDMFPRGESPAAQLADAVSTFQLGATAPLAPVAAPKPARKATAPAPAPAAPQSPTHARCCPPKR